MIGHENTTRLRWQVVDPGWAWVETVEGRREIMGASRDSPALAWGLGLCAGATRTLSDLRRLESSRDQGRIELIRASVLLSEEWAIQRR